jgi:hypothetical protein
MLQFKSKLGAGHTCLYYNIFCVYFIQSNIEKGDEKLYKPHPTIWHKQE